MKAEPVDNGNVGTSLRKGMAVCVTNAAVAAGDDDGA